jgi:hypothetical protein
VTQFHLGFPSNHPISSDSSNKSPPPPIRATCSVHSNLFDENRSLRTLEMSSFIPCSIFHHATEIYWRSGGIAPRFLNPALDGDEWSASRPSRFTHRGKRPRYPLDMRPSGPQSRSGRGSEKEKFSSLPLPGIEPQSSNS